MHEQHSCELEPRQVKALLAFTRQVSRRGKASAGR